MPSRLLTVEARSCLKKSKCLFQKIRLVINVTTEAREADVEKIKADLHRFCPVSKVIRNSGTQVEEVWNVTRP